MCRWVVWCVLCLFLVTTNVNGQPQYGFRISFTDKGGTTQSLSNPLGFLSQRAIDRRTAQSIAIDSTDLPVSPAYMDSVLTLTSGKVHMTSKWFNYTILLLNDSSKIQNIQGKLFIKSIEYIAYYSTGLHKGTGNNNTQTYAKTTGSSAYYGATYNQSALVNGDYLHDIGWKGQGKLIAVLDEGFAGVNGAPAFDSLMNSGRLKDQYNFVQANTNVFTSGQHGTTALSTMAGNLPGIYVGSAPESDYALYNTEVGGTEQVLEMDNIVAASERADSVGADVITISVGYDKFTLPVPFSLTYAEIDGKTTIATKGVNMATTKGILMVVSAGNEGGGSWNYILTPGDADSALTVGSVGLDKVPASNSGYGPNSAGTIKPNVCMPGAPAAVIRTTTTPTFTSGTSYATPQLAGWAACLMQASGNFTPYEIRTAIEKSAHRYGNPGPQLGHGVPNFHYALELLNVKEVAKMPDANNWVTVGPNPFNSQLRVRVYKERNADLGLQLTDMSGRVVYTYNTNVSVGTQTITLEMPHLPNGMYFLKITSDEEEKVLKMVRY
ncbi:MAG: S8 family peptidase [Chitinophagales bacterium]|nr:S8 family peptidase [Chitinophagaceae bacterium]MCB9063615.1 S8 family peptidase [Chitinophagales bacterium]